ncbi:MAG: hypothetical protein FP820_05040 [Sulfurimonas sp.]|jgi:hypothetical protein|nr:hypothetical protein [Sulfurimonas sp.]MBU1216920.1 hypothetical protein [bacterium]MBU1435047.1 hypothetical protein [bacterium]MBU1504152.1 hypothetical protein [bacterium]MBU3939971.1 hypothetical protein [bacterium]
MSKVIQAFLTGAFISFIFDFFIFLGIKENYIDFYKIDLYYNILFADNQNLFIYLLFSALFGYLVVYNNSNKIKLAIIGTFFIASTSTLIPAIGYELGAQLFMQKNQIFKSKRYTFRGDVYYIGRKNITFYDYDLQKTILLKKEELIQ